MARKPPKSDAPEAEDTPETRKRQSDKAIIEEARENFKLDIEADQKNRDRFIEQMRFCYEPGAQWEESVKRARGPKRVTREFNETRVKVKAVVNHIRSNRPTAKIRPVEEGDADTAEAMNGQALNIWNTSDADNVTDFAAETQVPAGFGAWMIDTEYSDESVSDQDIFIRPIRNPMCLVVDRAAKEQDKSDARHWNYFTSMPNSTYESRYGKAEKIASFAADEFTTDNDPNTDKDTVWLTAYWRKEPIVKNLCLLSTGETVDKSKTQALPEGVTIVKERAVKSHQIVQYILSATAILERNEWAGKYFPFVVAYGEYAIIDGKTVWYGMVQTMMDAQRSHNETLSGVYETIALSPQAKYWATGEQAKGYQNQWNLATEENLLVMLYNPDTKAPGPPVRVGGADVPAALMQASQMSRDSINSVSSVPDANVGMTSNESSGRAIRARQDSGLVGTYNYSDNMAKAIGRTYKILIDLIPKVIDTPRSLRILGKDGAEKYVKVNQFDPVTGQVLNDLSKGRYDFVVTQGPNVATQRQEAAETLTSLAQSDPMLMPTAGDIVYRNLDIPGAQEIAERIRATLPAPIQAIINKDAPEDPRVVAAMGQVQQMQQQLQEQAQVIQQAQAEAEKQVSTANSAKADVQIQLAKLDTKQANIATDVAKFETLVAKTQAQFAQQDAADTEARTVEQTTQAEADRTDTVAQLAQALAAIQQQSSEQAEALALLMQELHGQPKPSNPVVNTVTQRTQDGFETVASHADGTQKRFKSRKVNGQTVTDQVLQ